MNISKFVLAVVLLGPTACLSQGETGQGLRSLASKDTQTRELLTAYEPFKVALWGDMVSYRERTWSAVHTVIHLN